MGFSLTDPSTLNLGNYSSSLTGVSTVGNIVPSTSSAFTPLQGILVPTTTPVANRNPTTDMTTQIETTLPSVLATPDTESGSTMPQDAYRYGGYAGNTVSGDDLTFSRVLGEEDDNIASISLQAEVVPDGAQISGPNAQLLQTLSSGAPSGAFNGNLLQAYSRFMLQQVIEAEQEKMQVVETFTSFYTFFYGKRPPTYKYSGTLLNDQNHKWTNDFKFFYENYFRGTRAAELGVQAVLTYDGRIITGFIFDMQIGQTADQNKGASFSFDILVTSHTPTYFSEDINGLIQNLKQQLASQAALIQQQLAAVNTNVPTQQTILARQVQSGTRAPNSAVKTGTNPGGIQTNGYASALTQSQNDAQAAATKAASDAATTQVSKLLPSSFSGFLK